jgi:hypothetical protein
MWREHWQARGQRPGMQVVHILDAGRLQQVPAHLVHIEPLGVA